MSTLRIEALDFRTALKDISAVWEPGQLMGVIGPNGAGKSTLLKLVSGVERPDSGRVWLDGDLLGKLNAKERARRLAYLPQQVPVDVLFTVREFVEMGRYAHQSPWGGFNISSKQAVNQAIHRLNLDELVHTPLGQLSGGERQRAAIARCLAQETEVLVLDEPISNLDLYYQVEILQLLRQLASEGYLVVLAIHHLELAAQYCSHMTLLNHGAVYAQGKTEEVLKPEAVAEVFHMNVKMFRDPFDSSLRISCTPGWQAQVHVSSQP
ncbi:ABC transporter ATP-binding protein [Alicyclobacillus sp. SO9]|uniref:ABC transporter ATP-binding protein n=1 Tax=Alicyclobacillus sp. SO9 TaxID=2665646 RepID=UPI0018E89894|nr:ABC transporter ATP-binding protein [Alicyclobacillus sp. SO9]QQE79944.1 ABC transporter ATP-binding protein [Alicyclobacillus sp. SO9]